MVSKEQAQELAQDWIDAWNSRDIYRILSHYSDEVVFTSPFVVKLLGDNSGTIQGKADLKPYFMKGLEAYPNLKFELYKVLTGVDSITLYYKTVNEMLAAEVMELNSDGKITKVIAHYS
ncbi:MAG: nuclear transport factor 2 family protein [Thermodesulfobacteriota bacterium]